MLQNKSPSYQSQGYPLTPSDYASEEIQNALQSQKLALKKATYFVRVMVFSKQSLSMFSGLDFGFQYSKESLLLFV